MSELKPNYSVWFIQEDLTKSSIYFEIMEGKVFKIDGTIISIQTHEFSAKGYFRVIELPSHKLFVSKNEAIDALITRLEDIKEQKHKIISETL